MTSCASTGLTANVAGQTYDLNDGDHIRLLDYDLNMAAVRRLAQRGPEQHGDSDLGFRISARFLDLFWAIKGDDVAHYRELREMFLEIFRPRLSDPVQLIFDFDGVRRALDVHLDGELNWTERIESFERVSGIFKASDYRLYDPDIVTVPFSLGGGAGAGDGWAIPWEIPWEIGESELNVESSILYAGGSRLASPEYPVITIFGPITDPVITNETTGEVIDLSGGTGLVLADASEWVRIDLSGGRRRDSKTLRDQDGASVDHHLTTDSDLASWHLAYAGERLADGGLSDGTNVIRVTGSDVTTETLVVMSYYNRYEGK